MKKSWILIPFALIILLTACAPAQNPEVIATEIPAVASPDYDALWDPNPAYYCPNTWVSDQRYAGFGTGMEKLSEQIDGDIVTQTWRVYLEYIEINDHRVYTDNWHVVKIITLTDGDEKYAQELNPEKWVTRAKELATFASDLTLNFRAEWDGEYWDQSGECSK